MSAVYGTRLLSKTNMLYACTKMMTAILTSVSEEELLAVMLALTVFGSAGFTLLYNLKIDNKSFITMQHNYCKIIFLSFFFY